MMSPLLCSLPEYLYFSGLKDGRLCPLHFTVSHYRDKLCRWGGFINFKREKNTDDDDETAPYRCSNIPKAMFHGCFTTINVTING